MVYLGVVSRDEGGVLGAPAARLFLANHLAQVSVAGLRDIYTQGSAFGEHLTRQREVSSLPWVGGSNGRHGIERCGQVMRIISAHQLLSRSGAPPAAWALAWQKAAAQTWLSDPPEGAGAQNARLERMYAGLALENSAIREARVAKVVTPHEWT